MAREEHISAHVQGRKRKCVHCIQAGRRTAKGYKVETCFERSLCKVALCRTCHNEYHARAQIKRGYYTVARRYEFYVRVARTVSVSEIQFLPREHKFDIFGFLYKHADDAVFDDFPKISDHQRPNERFPNISKPFPRITED